MDRYTLLPPSHLIPEPPDKQEKKYGIRYKYSCRNELYVDSFDTPRRKKIHSVLCGMGLESSGISSESLDLYDQALTHSSFVRDVEQLQSQKPGSLQDNERLEFLGDRVLNLIVAEFLFCSFDEPEGKLTPRMEFTRNRNLGALVPGLAGGFEDLILVGENQSVTPGIIADAFEAFIGALFLDSGFDKTRDVVLSLVSDEIESFSPEKNYKKKLQEILQKQNRPLPVYSLVRKRGKDHEPEFTYRVTADGDISGEGSGSSKAEATQNAALDALRRMGLYKGK